MTILDTDVLIDFMHGIEEVKTALGDTVDKGLTATTIITQYELLKGAKSSEEEKAVTELVESIKVYQLDSETVRTSSIVFKELRKKGILIPDPDLLIAGVAIATGETLVTRDGHFKNVLGLKLLLI